MKAYIGIAAALLALASAPAAAREDITAPGTVAHRAAGTGFPERVGDFRRANVIQFDDRGLDISANYDLDRPGGRVRLSVYIYPAPPVPAGQRRETYGQILGFVAEAIEQQDGGATLLEDGPAPGVPGVDPGLGLRSVHQIRADFGNGVEPLRSESDLYCYVGGDWLVKFRASSPVGYDASRDIEAFIRLSPWPGRAMGEESPSIKPADAGPTI